MLNTANISALLRWALENVGCPINEITALNGVVHIRLSDGRAGILCMDKAGNPVAELPAAL